MSLPEAFEAFKTKVAPDTRVVLCDVTVRGGVLSGVADKRLEPNLYAFAAKHGVGSRVTFLAPTPQYVLNEQVFLRAAPVAHGERVSEVRYGERVQVFDREGNWYRVASEDDYLGWLPMTSLVHHLPAPTHRFIALRGHLYGQPAVSAERRLALAFGAQLSVAEGGNLNGTDDWASVSYGKGEQGFVKSKLLWRLGRGPARVTPGALVTFARRFSEVPYLWGGVSAWGLDCSGLVQSVYGAFGILLPRDSDQQAACGTEVGFDEVQPADLLFFPGHVAISLGGTRFLHANAHHMRVTVDDFALSEYGQGLRQQLQGVRRLELSPSQTAAPRVEDASSETPRDTPSRPVATPASPTTASPTTASQ